MIELTRARTRALETNAQGRDLARFIEWIDKTPSTHTIRGMYVSGLIQAINSRGFAPAKSERIQAFKEYPLRGYMELLLDSAITLYPQQGAHEGLRELGNLAIPTFAKSIAGGVVMATVGRSWDLALACVSRGYEISLRPGRCIVAENADGRALVQLRNVWNFPDSYQVGVIEGLMQWCKLEGRVTPSRTSMCNADLAIEWQVSRNSSRRPRTDGGSASASAPR